MTDITDIERRLRELLERSSPGPWDCSYHEFEHGGFGCTPDGCPGHLTNDAEWVDIPSLPNPFSNDRFLGESEDEEIASQEYKKNVKQFAADYELIAAATQVRITQTFHGNTGKAGLKKHKSCSRKTPGEKR